MRNIPDLCSKLDDEADGIVLTEEALAGARCRSTIDHGATSSHHGRICRSLYFRKRKPTSTRLDLPLILGRLGNVVLLERPVNAETLLSAVKSVLRARRRQYETRSLLAEQQKTAAQLRALNTTLEQRVNERTGELESARDTLEFALDFAGMGSWDLDLSPIPPGARQNMI